MEIIMKTYTQEQLDKETTEAYNKGYEDGQNFLYGTTKADEKRIVGLAAHIEAQDDNQSMIIPHTQEELLETLAELGRNHSLRMDKIIYGPPKE